MSKRLDPDVLVIKRCSAALRKSTSERMIRVNIEYLWDRFVVRPQADRVDKFGKGLKKLLSV